MNDIKINPKGEVWIFAEQEQGSLSEIPLELLSKGRELADQLGVKLAAVLLGDGVAPLADTLIHHGADIVHLVEDPKLATYQTTAYAKVLVDLVKAVEPQIFVFAATGIGRDLAPSVSSALRCGLTADCTDLLIGSYKDAVAKKTYDNLLLQRRPAFGGNIVATIVNPLDWPQMATVREGVMKMSEDDPSRTGEVVRHDSGLAEVDLPTEVLEILRANKTVNLKAARVIVAGGAGVGTRENFQLLCDLAEALGGAVAGSRAAVDLGFIDGDRQIGQTGVTVHPALYIACGISGAVQHTSGMQDSAKILAINTDKDAPIFSLAHYGIVGDLKVVLPRMIKAVRDRAQD